jgi:hypothetical protein
MKVRKSHLRECARVVLEQRGYRVELIGGAGIVPGARLRAFEGPEVRDIAVRTSLDREVGLTRHPDGRWKTIPRVHEVIVVVPAAEALDSAEVLSFSPDVIIQAFDAELAAREGKSPDFSWKSPIFLALDKKPRGRRGDGYPGLKDKADWQVVVPLGTVPPQRLSPETPVGLIDRVRQELAKIHGVDVSKVTVEFRITS